MQRPESGQDHQPPRSQDPRQGVPEKSGQAKEERPELALRKMILNKLNEWQIDTEIESAMLTSKKNAKHNRS